MFRTIMKAYGINETAPVQPFGSGLINHTWKIQDGQQAFILQQINTDVFKEPAAIADNIATIAAHLTKTNPGYLFVTPVHTIDGSSLYFIPGKGYFRLFPFVRGSHTIDVAGSALQAFEAARQFGLFTKTLKSLPVSSLRTTLPDFHNLSMRYTHFQQSCLNGDRSRIEEAAEEIRFIQDQDHIVSTFEFLRHSPEFKLRVTHHDTKISNILFGEDDRGLCVIDLDTVMPGYYISDVGDMMRTYLSPVSEEEKDFGKIEIRDEYFVAILQGYLGEMENELSELEKSYFVYAGKFMIYMQAVRFLADHLNNDSYYGADYDGQNYVRAKNQIMLLDKLMAKESYFNELVAAYADKQPVTVSINE